MFVDTMGMVLKAFVTGMNTQTVSYQAGGFPATVRLPRFKSYELTTFIVAMSSSCFVVLLYHSQPLILAFGQFLKFQLNLADSVPETEWGNWFPNLPTSS